MNRKNRLGQTPLLDHLQAVAPYPPGKPIEEVQREYNLREVIKLASNENPLGPSPRALRAMARAASEMNLYPDGGGFYLKQALAKRLGVQPEQIVLGNGSDEITLFLALCYLAPGRSMITSEYAFVRHRMAGELVNAEVRVVPMKEFRHDVAGILNALDGSTRLIFLDNPCNPTGTIVGRAGFRTLLNETPPEVLIVADEAYYEFAKNSREYPDSLALRKKHPNLIVTRTFSKAYGLAGLRIGYGIAAPEIIDDLDRVRPPFNTSRIAQAAATAALGDTPHLKKSIDNNTRGISDLTRALTDLGLKVIPSHANFVLVDFSATGRTGAEIYEELLREGVIIRPMGGYGLHSFARISIGTPKENRQFLQSLRKVLSL